MLPVLRSHIKDNRRDYLSLSRSEKQNSNYYSTYLKVLLEARAGTPEGVRGLSLRNGLSQKLDKRIAQPYHPHVDRSQLLLVVHAHAGVIHQTLDFVGVVVVYLKRQGQKPPGGVTEKEPNVIGQDYARRSVRPGKDIREVNAITAC